MRAASHLIGGHETIGSGIFPTSAECFFLASAVRSASGMEIMYSLVHCEAGPLATFLTKQEASRALLAALRDEPSLRGDLVVEVFTLIVEEPDAPTTQR